MRLQLFIVIFFTLSLYSCESNTRNEHAKSVSQKEIKTQNQTKSKKSYWIQLKNNLSLTNAELKKIKAIKSAHSKKLKTLRSENNLTPKLRKELNKAQRKNLINVLGKERYANLKKFDKHWKNNKNR